MLKTPPPLVLALTILLGLSAAQAGDKEIRQAIRGLAADAKVKSISPSPFNGLSEVVVEGERGPSVVYADPSGRYLFVGDLLDISAQRNLTRERIDKLTEVKWDSLPLKDAIKVVRGNGQRKLAVFSDPDCPYCKKAEVELNKLDNVTVYTFLYPLDFHTDAARKSKLVWCAKDRAQAWLDLMLKGVVPTGKASCDTPLDANRALGAKLRVEGTPAIIFANGKRLPGYAPAERLESLLAQAAR